MTDRIYDFDGRVAVVTGAGRGLGRAYALLLAELGAKVVVNDLGGAASGEGSDEGPAQRVVAEIVEAGGVAVADTSDISTPAGGRTPIELAVEEFGRIDIVVNNAGNIDYAGLPDIEEDNLERHLAVHVKGSFNTTRAAWPHFLEQNYGRVVHTTSIGQFGLPDNLGYATAKAAMLGLARTMTASVGDRDIKVNVVAPNAVTRMAGEASEGMDAMRQDAKRAPTKMEPELVAPLVAYLAHDSCAVSGEAFLGGGGRFAQLFVGITDGWIPEDPYSTSVADIASHLDRIKDRSAYFVPANLGDAVGYYFSHLRPS